MYSISSRNEKYSRGLIMSKEFECKFCQSIVTWPAEYKKGSGPVNPDGSKHNCKKTEEIEPEPETKSFGIIIAIVAFNVQSENSIAYKKVSSEKDAGFTVETFLRRDDVDFISIRKVKK